MTAATTNPSPKTRFQEKTGAIEAHHNLLQSDHFQRAEDLALLHYQRVLAAMLGKSTNPQVDGMVNAWKLQGAQEFLSEFRNLAEKPMAIESPGVSRVLNHQA